MCNSDNLSRSFQHVPAEYYDSVAAREMPMVFRHRAGGRGVFMSSSNVKPLGRPPLQPPPYWKDKGCINGEVGQKLIPGTADELAWMQEILDNTFKNKVTRDRKDGPPPSRSLCSCAMYSKRTPSALGSLCRTSKGRVRVVPLSRIKLCYSYDDDG